MNTRLAKDSASKTPDFSEASDKDSWDKAEIIAKLIGSTAIPVIVALSVYAWNSERNAQEGAARNLQIALEVLRSPPLPDRTDEIVRRWAIQVLQSPMDSRAFPDVDAVFLGRAVDSVLCEESLKYQRDLGLALIEDGGPSSLRAGRNLMAILDAGCNFQRLRNQLGE